MDKNRGNGYQKKNSIDESISELMNNWNNRKEVLSTLFRQRDKDSIQEPMNESIVDYFHFLFWSNEREAPNMERCFDIIEQLEYKPMNLKERFDYIRKNPSHYHSFIQLSELYNEQSKQYAKRKLLQAKNN
ncbi:YpoC family protein [Fredinandcohnia humi]